MADRRANEMIHAAMQPKPQQVGLQVASPINDTQLIAIMACFIDGDDIVERVKTAMNLLAESIIQTMPEANINAMLSQGGVSGNPMIALVQRRLTARGQ